MADDDAVALPPQPEEMEELDVMDVVEDDGKIRPLADQPPPPTRTNFAGRTRTGSEAFQKDWDTRRQKYYECVPPSFWKDHFEREFWSFCTFKSDMDLAMKEFFDKIGFEPPPPPAAKKSSAKKQPEPKQRAEPKKRGRPPKQSVCKSSAKPKASSGKGRGRGRKGKQAQ